MTLLSIFTTPLGSCVELYRRDRDGQYFVIHTEPNGDGDQVDRFSRERDARAGYDRVVRSVRKPRHKAATRS